MEQSGTPSPFEGKIGKRFISEQWKKYDKLRPDYAQYTDRLRVVEKAEDEYEQKLKLKEWKDKLDAAEKIRNGDVDVDKTFNQSEAEMIKQKIEELKADINKSKKVNVEVTVGDEEVKKESKELNPK